jgi:uncharacterized protein (UPF0248 family)
MDAMSTTAPTPKLIDKEEISNLVFPPESIHRSKDERSILNKKLRDAMVLGNIHHSKIRIIFEDAEGLKEVRTTVWAAGDEFIVLKKGVSIPVRRIVDLHI